MFANVMAEIDGFAGAWVDLKKTPNCAMICGDPCDGSIKVENGNEE